jgi:hypothetical protein
MKTGGSVGVPDRGEMRAEQTTGERQSYTAGGKRYVPARACAEQGRAADCLQRLLRSRFWQQLTPGVGFRFADYTSIV